MPVYGGGAPYSKRFDRKRINLSALMSAVCLTKLAQPYSASHRVIGRVGRFWQTNLSCAAAFSMGFSKLVIRSCNSGNAQLPSVSGTTAMVL